MDKQEISKMLYESMTTGKMDLPEGLNGLIVNIMSPTHPEIIMEYRFELTFNRDLYENVMPVVRKKAIEKLRSIDEGWKSVFYCCEDTDWHSSTVASMFGNQLYLKHPFKPECNPNVNPFTHYHETCVDLLDLVADAYVHYCGVNSHTK